MSKTEVPEAEAPDDAELTRYQMEVLYTLAVKHDQSEYGLGIMEDLEAYYGESLNHGRHYPNLDELVDAGYLDKSEKDKRTNEYTLTEAGERLVERDAEQRQAAAEAIRGEI